MIWIGKLFLLSVVTILQEYSLRAYSVRIPLSHARGGITLIADGRTTQKVLMQLGMGRELQYLVSFSTNDDKANDSFYSEACAMHPLFGCIQRATTNNAIHALFLRYHGSGHGASSSHGSGASVHHTRDIGPGCSQTLQGGKQRTGRNISHGRLRCGGSRSTDNAAGSKPSQGRCSTGNKDRGSNPEKGQSGTPCEVFQILAVVAAGGSTGRVFPVMEIALTQKASGTALLVVALSTCALTGRGGVEERHQ